MLLRFVLLLVIASPLQAQPWHWVSHHKELLAADGLIFLAWSADAASSVACQRERPKACVETNALLGKHPSAAASFGYALGLAGAQSTLNGLIWWSAGDSPGKHIIWLPTIAFTVLEIPNVKDNVQIAAAHSRLLRKP